jgi:hypothetical protein
MIPKEKSEEEKVKYLANVAVRIIKLMFYIIFLCNLQNSVYAETGLIKKEKAHVINWRNLEAVIKGEHLKAILVAYEDFSKDVNETKAKTENQLYPNSLAAYSTKLENYDISVSKGSEGYTIIFKLRLSDRYPALMGDGGITRYIVDSKTYKLVEIDKQK